MTMWCAICYFTSPVGPHDRPQVPAMLVVDGYSLCGRHANQVLDLENAVNNQIWYDTNNKFHLRATVQNQLARRVFNE